MGKRDDLIAKYADDLKTKCKVTPDMALLTKVTIGCGPSIYDNDAQTVAAGQETELETVKKNFLMKKLGLADSPKLMEGINQELIGHTFEQADRWQVQRCPCDVGMGAGTTQSLPLLTPPLAPS